MSDFNSILEKLSAEKSNSVFRPVKTNEAAMKAREPVDGLLYFAVDSHKIYLGNEEKYVPMGGNSGVFYGSKVLSEVDFPEPIFEIDDIDNDQMPLINDLIINESSSVTYNGFYRVIEVISDREVRTVRLEVGGGGTGGGGGPSTGAGFAKIEYVSPVSASDSTLISNPYTIIYNLVATDNAGDPITNSGTALWKVNGTVVASQNVYPGENKFKIDQYFDPSKDVNEINLSISIDTGGETLSVARKSWSIKAVDLRLEWKPKYGADNGGFNSGNQFVLSWTPYGGIDCVTYITFDGNKTFKFDIKSYETGTVITRTFDSLEYGSHTVEMYLKATVAGEDYYTDSIFGEAVFNKPGTGTNVILSVPFYQKKTTQYNTLEIPFVVYDPNNELAKVNFYVDGELEYTKEYNRNLQYWNYTVEKAGTVELSIVAVGGDTWTTELIVSEIDLNVSEPGGAAFKLSAKTLPDSRQYLENWEQNGTTLTFSDNFDWDNGGVKSEVDENGDVRKFISIKNGTSMTINYNLFGNAGSNDGKVFKFIFKTSDCYDYDAKILECYEKVSNIGLRINAQNAYFTTGTVSLNTQYYEDSYIEFEAEIWPEAPGITADRFAMLWVDGVPASVVDYKENEVFQQSNPRQITIGSNQCDVNVYLVKVYEKKLNNQEHLSNFILDAPTTKEMLRRYERNDILDNLGKISYEKLVEKNPDCPAHLYEIPFMTKHKKDYSYPCVYQQYHSNPKKPDYIAYDVMMKVQGTSSVKYGVAAFNVDSAFYHDKMDQSNQGMRDGDGNLLRYYDDKGIEKEYYKGFWAMRENSEPIDYSCTKVNVASCENANNAVNAEWYDKHQPYWDGHRRKNHHARDCMEFIPGVMFIKDKNNRSDFTSLDDYYACNVFCDDPDYMRTTAENRPYRQYAICNMGNSKDNTNVFHDADNPNACCVEVTDNQNTEHWMTTKLEPNEDGNYVIDDNFYEFRYPDGNDKAKQPLHNGWAKFVNWMASCDPSPYHPDTHPYGYTNMPLENGPVTFGPYTFRGFDPPGFEGTTSPTGISLKGLKIETFAGTYDRDTKEYRMAKMLSECEDHLVMDSVVYHYLFIQRHTMVDNVAKNTFWSSEDLEHWDLTKNYDNDTANGNNNTGFLTYKYGIEAMDTEERKDNESGELKTVNIFNAPDSVWFNFIYNLDEVQKDLYVKLNNVYADNPTGAWDARAYLREFQKYQDVVPERCWIEDFTRKYLRPRRLGFDGDSSYLARLQGGKKTHQRNQYETYQEYYMSSKYLTSPAFGGALDFRANSGPSFSKDTVTPLSTYIDCYGIAELGGNILHKRLKRGEIWDVPVGQAMDNPKDATSYYHSARMIQSLKGIEDIYTSYVQISNAGKMRAISVGSDKLIDGKPYRNPNLKTIGFESNKMLESIAVQNSGSYSETESENLPALDLRTLVSLRELKINGSTFPGVMFAENGMLETAQVCNVKVLEMSNLQHLKSFIMDENPEGSPYKYNLTQIKVNNCPNTIDTLYLVQNSNILHYQLQGINWTITKNTLASGDNLETIDILEKLLKITNNIYGNTAVCLTGTITIDMACNVDEYKVYQRYCKQYPNLEILYSDKATIKKAHKLTFMTDDTDNKAVLYTVLSDGKDNIDWLTSVNGPLGIAIKEPTKAEIPTTRYIFSHYWKDQDGQRYYDKTILNPDEGSLAFTTTLPQKDMIFIPEFNEETRYYEVKFFIDDVVVPQKYPNGEYKNFWPVEYNHIYDGPIKNFAYKEHPAMDKRYKFLGWSLDAGSRNPEFINLATFKITSFVSLYAYFKEESVFENATSYEYFNITSGVLTLKDEYKGVLQGKVTIPLTDPANNPIYEIGDYAFYNTTQITHIFFQSGNSKYTKIGNYAFARGGLYPPTAILTRVDLPDKLQTIGSHAFEAQYNLQMINLPDSILRIEEYAFAANINENQMSVSIDKLPDNLTFIGSNAFFRGGDNITIKSIPNGVTSLLGNTFGFCRSVDIRTFGVDSGKGLTSIGQGDFNAAGQNVTLSPGTIVTFNSSVDWIANWIKNGDTYTPIDSAFLGSYLYNNPNVTIVIKNQSLYDVMETTQSTGFGTTPVEFRVGG